MKALILLIKAFVQFFTIIHVYKHFLLYTFLIHSYSFLKINLPGEDIIKKKQIIQMINNQISLHIKTQY